MSMTKRINKNPGQPLWQTRIKEKTKIPNTTNADIIALLTAAIYTAVGRIVVVGTPEQIAANPESVTGKFI